MSSKNIFFFHGKDRNHFKHHCEKIIGEKIFSQATNLETLEFSGYELLEEEKLQELHSLLANESLFDLAKTKKAFVIWDYHFIHRHKKIEKLIASCLPHHYLFLFTREKKKYLSALEKKFKEKIFVMEEKYVDKKFLKTKIKDFFSHKLTISEEVLHHLTDHFVKEADFLDRELEKILLYAYPNKKVSLEEVKKVVVQPEGEKEAYALVNSFFTRKKELVLNEVLHFISAKNSFPQFVSLMIRELSLVLHFSESGKSHSIFNELKVFHAFQRENVIKRSSTFNRNELVFLIDKFINLEKKTKSNFFPKHRDYKNVDLVSLNYFIKMVLHVC